MADVLYVLDTNAADPRMREYRPATAEDVTDEMAERLSRAVTPEAWAIISTFNPKVRVEYEDALRDKARAALVETLAVDHQEGGGDRG